jgi:uncharacterized protein
MKWIIVCLVVVTAGCTSSSPTYTQYLLRHDMSTTSAIKSSEESIAIGRLEVATYIDSLGLVLETADGEINVARYHQWAEPLRESLRQYLASSISMEAEVPVRFRKMVNSERSKRIDIYIDQLHGDATGHAKLAAYWTVTDVESDEVVVDERFFSREPLPHDGYSALVTAKKVLLENFSKAISASL